MVELQEAEKPIIAFIDTMQVNLLSAPWRLTTQFASQSMGKGSFTWLGNRTAIACVAIKQSNFMTTIPRCNE